MNNLEELEKLYFILRRSYTDIIEADFNIEPSLEHRILEGLAYSLTGIELALKNGDKKCTSTVYS